MASPSLLTRTLNELGITTLLHSPRDVHILLSTRFIRMFAYGSSTLILALFFSALGHSDTAIGLFMSLTLVGDVLISLLLTLVADRLGRRRILLLGALLMVLSGIVFSLVSNYWILLLAAVIGVISPSGNEIGPFRAVEESTLAHLTEAKTRSDIFALYVVAGTLGASGGTLVAGWVTQAVQGAGWSELASFRLVFWLYAIIGFVKAGMTLLLSNKCEAQPEDHRPSEMEMRSQRQDEQQQPFLEGEDEDEEPASKPPPPPPKKTSWFQLSEKSRYTLLKLCGIFFFDSLASGMVPVSLIAYYISNKFSIAEGTLGTIMASAQFISSIGNIFASSVAKRIGLVRTMVFTHLPSAIFLLLLPAPSSLWMTIVLLIARSTLNSMDQAPRSAFLSAVVLPEERTAVMGIVNTVKTSSQSSGPLITGALAAGNRFWVAFVVAGSLKASYDLMMLSMFRNTPLEGDQGSRSQRAPEPESAEDEDQNDDRVQQRS
ncbi:hypothetical protein PRZ48_003365 [Zasmidium cellare]|uniref:Major facilitator superfamily (MFS) profile domain-containing protein n=1 Tax=Zasmidium cellare TaxID=395010 RepID=A0ABR0EV82_ZASCE|nr:hypothetical protein PRZ48_003365 [Zasmidium cellare]